MIRFAQKEDMSSALHLIQELADFENEPDIFAAYASAGSGKKVTLPFKTNVDKPYKLWKEDKH
jgi:hypothetical protein